MFLQEKKKTFTLSTWKKVFFPPARKLGGLHRVVTAPDRCLCIRIHLIILLGLLPWIFDNGGDCCEENDNFGTTLGRLWDNFGTTLGQVWDNFGTTLGPLWHDSETILSVFHCSYLVVTATRTMSKKTRAPAPPAPITCSRWNRLLVSPLFFYNHQFVCVLPSHTELADLN